MAERGPFLVPELALRLERGLELGRGDQAFPDEELADENAVKGLEGAGLFRLGFDGHGALLSSALMRPE
jgi:hypothetical protein